MQKFRMGDLVQVADDLGPMMSHFTSGRRAIVMGSYNDKYGGGNIESYSLWLEGRGECSWYYEWQLTLIEKNRCDLLEEWQKECDDKKRIESDLDWIFQNGPKFIEDGGVPGNSIAAIAACLGCTNMWGSNGEGINYYNNSRAAFLHAKPFLETGDRNGWDAYCELFKASRKS